MGRTYVFGPPKWRCENCGRFNKMRNKPSPGHTVTKRCSGCDYSQEVTNEKDYSNIALLTIIIVSIGVAGPAALAFWFIVLILWLVAKRWDTKSENTQNTNRVESSSSKNGDTDDTNNIDQESYKKREYKSNPIDNNVSDEKLTAYQIKEKARFGDIVYVCGGCGSDVASDDTKCPSCKCRLTQ